MISELDQGIRGFTIVIGLRAKQILSANDVVSGRRWVRDKLIDSLRAANGSHRPLNELTVRIGIDGKPGIDRIRPEQIEEDPNWVVEYRDLPSVLHLPSDRAELIQLSQPGDARIGRLLIRKSKAPLSGRRKGRNQVLVFDPSRNPVGAFPIADLHAGNTDHTRFLFCELHVEFPEIEEHVENDRVTFRTTPQMGALKEWLRVQLNECVVKLDEDLKDVQRRRELQAAERLNTMLNQYAESFLRQLETEVIIDWRDEEGGGEGGDTSGGKGSGGQTSGTGGGSGSGGGRKDEPGTTKSVRRPRFPRILLSGHDADPAATDGESKNLQPGHPPVYQSEADLLRNIWWINTSHVFAEEALRRGGPRGHAWREYHFFMFRDIVQIEHLRMLRRHDAEMGLDQLENDLLQKSSEFLSRLTQTLAEEILE